MSFLDNLENNLKALEGREERDPEAIAREKARRDAEREDALKTAPYAQALKKSPFTADLLRQCRTVGHGQRVLVQFLWLPDGTLRLDAREKRLELRPTPDGIVAVHLLKGAEQMRHSVSLDSNDPAELATRWLEESV